MAQSNEFEKPINISCDSTKMNEVKRLQSLIIDLKECLKVKEETIQQLQKKIKQTDQSSEKNMTKDEVDQFVQSHLPMLTNNQIKLMTKHKRRVNWTPDEISKGFTSSFFSQRGHEYWVKNLKIPLPAIRTLNDWATKMTIAPGILTDVIFMLKGYVQTLTEGERKVVLVFDEMACHALVKYHKGLDQILGPNTEMQVIMVRGLMSKFKQPIYADFDTALTKKTLYEVITELNHIGLNVVGMVSDCGGKNIGLWNELDINCTRDCIKNSFKHPVTGKNVYVFADAPHMLKLLRNWFLDGGFVLPDGTILKKHKVYELFQKVKTEKSPAFKLTEKHFDCKATERMNVSLAAELHSHTVATCMSRYFQKDDEAKKLSDFIELVNQWFDVMNLYTPTGPWYKRAYGLELKYQDQVLEYIAGWIQKKLSYGNPLLSRAPKSIKTTQSELKTSFVDDVSKGGLTKPDDLLLNMVKNMENEFFKIHGNAFTKQPNIRKNLVSVLKQKYPEIPDDLVSLFARSRIYFRCSFLNKQAEDEAIIARIEKRKKKAEKLKLEIASQLGQQACFEDQKTLSIESVTDANQKSNQSADDDTAMSKICIGPSIGRKNVSKADVETVADSSKSTCETASKKPTRRQKPNATIKEKINIGNNEPSSSQSKELYSTENQSSAASNVKRRKDRKMKQFLK